MNRSERERAGFHHLRLIFQKEQKKKEKKKKGRSVRYQLGSVDFESSN